MRRCQDPGTVLRDIVAERIQQRVIIAEFPESHHRKLNDLLRDGSFHDILELADHLGVHLIDLLMDQILEHP